MGKSVDYDAIALRLGTVFRPATPIDKENLFCGRKTQVQSVVDTINQPGKHAIIFGERGVGKTSLGQILQVKLKAINDTPIIAPLVTCDSSDNFSTIWGKVLIEVDERMQRLRDELHPPDGPPDDEDEEEEENVPEEIDFETTPHDVRKHLERTARDGLVYVILDEFDKIADEDVRQLTADTIKLLSDRAVQATIIVIGISDDVTGLIADHRSIQRCLTEVPMPRMPSTDLEQIVVNGLGAANMTITAGGLLEITGLSKGLPHYTHLLALNAARQALEQKQLAVTDEHVKKAVGIAVDYSYESIRAEYDTATFSTKTKALHKQILLACAMARYDEFGRFSPGSLCEPLHRITKEDFTTDRFMKHLHAFCEKGRGNILEKFGAEYRWKFRFTNPSMQPYVLMKGLRQGIITEQDCRLNERRPDELF